VSGAGATFRLSTATTISEFTPDRLRAAVAEILWGPYQEHHITARHGVAAEEFEAAWTERIDLLVRRDDSYESVGATNDGREVYLPHES
jgi:hypothetical protein